MNYKNMDKDDLLDKIINKLERLKKSEKTKSIIKKGELFYIYTIIEELEKE